MFFDPNAWPPAPNGFDPPPPPPRISPAGERMMLRLISAIVVALLVAPLAGSSVINAVVALVRSAVAALG